MMKKLGIIYNNNILEKIVVYFGISLRSDLFKLSKQGVLMNYPKLPSYYFDFGFEADTNEKYSIDLEWISKTMGF